MMTPKQIHAMLKRDGRSPVKPRSNPLTEVPFSQSRFGRAIEGMDGEEYVRHRRTRRASRPAANNSHIRVGNRVKVMRPQKPFFGTVKRVSAKSFNVVGDDGRKWRIPATYPMTVVSGPKARLAASKPKKMSKSTADYIRVNEKMRNYNHPFYRFVAKIVSSEVNSELKFFGKKKDPRRPYIFTAEMPNSAYSVVTILSPQAMARMAKAVKRKYPKAKVSSKKTTHRSEID